MVNDPQRCPTLLTALDWFYNQTLVQTNAEAIAQLNLRYLPTVMFRLETELGSHAMGLVCQGLSCQVPANSWEQLQAQVCYESARCSGVQT